MSEPVEYCSICRTPYLRPVKKFNGGNPVWVSYPACTCEEDKLEAEVAERFARPRMLDVVVSPDESEAIVSFGGIPIHIDLEEAKRQVCPECGEKVQIDDVTQAPVHVATGLHHCGEYDEDDDAAR